MNIIQKMKSSLLVVATLATLAVPALVPASTHAACNNIGNKVGEGASSAAAGGIADAGFCSNQSKLGENNIGKVASGIVNIFSIIVGAIAVIMVIYGGFRYITSGGDSGRVGSAKNTLIYAVVGLIIVALAQVIVQFVLKFSGDQAVGGA